MAVAKTEQRSSWFDQLTSRYRLHQLDIYRLTDNETMPETTQEESRPPKFGVSIPTPSQSPLQKVQDRQTGHTESGVLGSVMQVLERVDDDLERLFPGVQSRVDPEKGGHLTSGDVDGGPGHETGYRWLGDEFYDPSQPQQADSEDDEPGDECQCGSDHLRLPSFAGMVLLHIRDDVGGLQRHDSDGPDGDVFGRGKEGVGEDTDEGRVETIFDRKTGEFGV
jgi:hypothetical protein